MDEATFKSWWALHLRKAKGETLSDQELRSYNQGAEVLDAEEDLAGGVAAMKARRLRVLRLKAENALMHKRCEELDRQIAALEGQLDERSKRLFGVEG
jgi:hypothetical protein